MVCVCVYFRLRISCLFIRLPLTLGRKQKSNFVHSVGFASLIVVASTVIEMSSSYAAELSHIDAARASTHNNSADHGRISYPPFEDERDPQLGIQPGAEEPGPNPVPARAQPSTEPPGQSDGPLRGTAAELLNRNRLAREAKAIQDAQASRPHSPNLRGSLRAAGHQSVQLTPTAPAAGDSGKRWRRETIPKAIHPLS